MNKIWIFPILVASANAIAASIPSNLPDGKYTMACQNITIEKYDPPAPGSADNPVPKGTDSNGITRRVQNQTGTSIYISSGDSTTIKDVYTIQSDDFTVESEDLTQKTIKSVGGNQFEESATVTSTSKVTPKDSGEVKVEPTTTTDTYNWKRTLAVQGNFEVNLKSKNGDDPETPGRGESLVTKNADGSYTIVSYVREGYHQDRKDMKNGAFTLGRFIYQSDSICTYIPAK